MSYCIIKETCKVCKKIFDFNTDLINTKDDNGKCFKCQQLPYSPWDLLPVNNPKEEFPEDTYFYDNVIQHLLPDLIQIEAEGIPIDLNKVSELEDVLINVLEEVDDILSKNPLMIEFLNSESKAEETKCIEEYKSKEKSFEHFRKAYNDKNVEHRTLVVNTYLKDRPDLQQEKWSIKDLKKLNEIIGSNFIDKLLNKKIESFMLPIINEAMDILAKEKAKIFNKNHVEEKVQKILDNGISLKFNPGSSLQKQKLFSFLGIDSTNTTNAGNPQWDREELEKVYYNVKDMINEIQNKKDVSNESKHF